MLFTDVHPSLESHWRAIILFGRNSASYKFALGKTLLSAASGGRSVWPLSELALPYAKHIAEHLKAAPKQATREGGRFLDACRRFNEGELSEGQLAEAAQRDGFNNVIDAFHVVGPGAIKVRFFEDERAGPAKGVRLTDEAFRLVESFQHRNLALEVEARWRLVETAWELKMPARALWVAYDDVENTLVAEVRAGSRKSVTGCREALNGYQKGKCFYCFGNISLVGGEAELAEVDHFFPHVLKGRGAVEPIDGVWNLVLACQGCNRGAAGKFAGVPECRYLERLHRRNEFLIQSHHPLRETLMGQTGQTEARREAFLGQAARRAVDVLIHRWKPGHEHEPAF